MKEIVLIRGIPGSGKSTMARGMTTHMHYEADMYHIDDDGVYKFNAGNTQISHEWCAQMAKDAISLGASVVVSNTFTRMWEMKPYYDIAAQFGASVRVIIATGEYESVHNVPAEVVARMKERFEQ